jgi:hypothetical protein
MSPGITTSNKPFLALTVASISRPSWSVMKGLRHLIQRCNHAPNGIAPHWKIPLEIPRYMREFNSALKDIVRPKVTCSNLAAHQLRALKALRNKTDFIILQCDKNMGPAIIEREEYIALAIKDHLRHTNT